MNRTGLFLILVAVSCSTHPHNTAVITLETQTPQQNISYDKSKTLAFHEVELGDTDNRKIIASRDVALINPDKQNQTIFLTIWDFAKKHTLKIAIVAIIVGGYTYIKDRKGGGSSGDPGR